jgi:wobble nucleotide-excising tRNase
MKLVKVVSLKNIGRFRDYSAKGQVDFARYTFVFAENGRGKTTFCAVLRSLMTGEPSYILGRKTLGATGQPEVCIRLDNATATFSNERWNADAPNLAIFDSVFISQNVYSGDIVGHEHKRNLYQLIVGKQGVDLAREYQHDVALKAKNDEIRAARNVIQPFAPSGMTVDAFLAAEPDPDIDSKIEAKQNELQAVREVSTLLARADLAPLQLPVRPADLEATLAATVEGVAADVGQRVAEHIAAHDMRRGEPWLSEGLGYLKTDSCPFCAQSVKGIAFVDALKGFFSTAYGDLKTRVQSRRSENDTALSDRVIGQIETTVARNNAGIEFWARYSTFSAPTLGTVDLGGALRTLREATSRLLERKSQAILEPVVPRKEFTEALESYGDAREAVKRYNDAVQTTNAAIAAKKKATQAADEAALAKELAHLRALKRRSDKTVTEAFATIVKLASEKAAIDKKKDEAKTALDTYTDTVLAQYESAINRYLDHFNAGFRIGRTTYDYRGAGEPRSTYQIVINEVAVDLGDDATPLHIPSFKNTLSAGDRSTLALAFFFAQLDRDPNKVNKVVVFDDPFASQDSFRRAATGRKVIRTGSDCAQVVLLSHDVHFLDHVWSQLEHEERESLCFARVGRENTVIQPYDIPAAVNAAYRVDIAALQTYHSEGKGDRREVAKKLRPTVEAHLRNVYPQDFGDLDSLGKMLAKIRDEGMIHPIASEYEILDSINEYGTPYQHAPKPGTPAPPIDDAELSGYCKRVLEVVGAV